MPIEPLISYIWPTDAVPLAGLTVRLDDLAARFEVPIRTWEVDGLGAARGFTVRLPSGRVVGVMELEIVTRHRAAGPVVLVDATDLAAHGPETVAADLIAGLDLVGADLTRSADVAARQMAVDLVTKFAAAEHVRAPDRGER
jgi:hypothetical protein